MVKTKNRVTLSGYLYRHNLADKVAGPNAKVPGQKYIEGSISIATDDELTNIVDIYYRYVTPTNSKGDNPLYGTLSKILHGELLTVMGSDKDTSAKLSASTSFALNEFYSDASGQETLVSTKRNENGFLHVINVLPDSIDQRNLFDVNMLVTNVREVEGDPDKGITDKVIVKGCIFDFRGAILPVEFSATTEASINYFLSLEVSPKAPIYTQLRGRELSTVVISRREEEGAFGESFVTETRSSKKDCVIHWASKEPLRLDDDGCFTTEELKKLMADREMHLAELKSRRDAYKASKATTAVDNDDDGFSF